MATPHLRNQLIRRQYRLSNPLEFSFNFDSPVVTDPKRTLSTPSARAVAPAVLCKYCSGLYSQAALGTLQITKDFVCVHCVNRVDRGEVNATNGCDSFTSSGRSAFVEETLVSLKNSLGSLCDALTNAGSENAEKFDRLFRIIDHYKLPKESLPTSSASHPQQHQRWTVQIHPDDNKMFVIFTRQMNLRRKIRTTALHSWMYVPATRPAA